MKTLLLLLLLSISARAEDVNVTIAWDKNPEPDIAYYNIRFGTQTGAYTRSVRADGSTVTIALPKDVMHFAVVHAVNTSGMESQPSIELAFQVYRPGEGKVPSAPVGLRKPVNLNASLEMSRDLKVWAVVFSQAYTGVDASAFWRVCLAEN
jgi:hypothetical protein